MKREFSIGSLISIILAGIGFMPGPHKYVGLALFVLAFIWAYLFVSPFSPVKRYWWSVSDKLVIMTLQTPGYKAKVTSEYITVWVELRPRSSIMVDRIVIKIGRERITSFDWKSHEVAAREYKFVDFERPNWLGVGEHETRLIAYTPEGYSKSGKFILEVTYSG
jgi:hypothetical protein